MTVFKGFITLIKRNIFMCILYLVIFMSICISIQMLTGGKGTTQFEEERLKITVIDRDGGDLAESLKEYLGEKHDLVTLKDDENVIQENLFYRNIYYVLTIPEGFEEKCLDGTEKLKTTKIPGTTSAFYVDQQIDTFLNDVRVLKASGFTVEEAVEEVKKIGDMKTEVTLLDKNGYGGERPAHAYMFQFMPYMMISVLCYIIGFIMIAYRKKDVRQRIRCSATSLFSQNLQLVMGYIVFGIGFWIICMLMPTVLYTKDFVTDRNLGYYLLNSFVMMLVSLSISFCVGVLVEREEIVNGVVNVISLGMSFTCGVFVSMSVLGKGVRAVAHFLPVYWYEIVNETIADNGALSASQQTAVWQGIGIQLLFAAAILGVGMMLSKRGSQE
ncbi:ABC transporter permease [Sporofaciens sp. SGI.106]|uniref:ABC transporter permease n=1 Tax=Sporofaciens sp. SGI.106 TaxID=3420568 RepID=UPI003D03ED0C